MPLKESLRAQICQRLITPNYPVWDFDKWVKASGIDPLELLCRLNELQMQLEIEAQALRDMGEADADDLLQHQYWCFYCEQVRSYYRTLLRHPELEGCLAPLLAECSYAGDDAHPLSRAVSFVTRAERPRVTADHPPSQAHPRKRSDE